MKLFSRLAFFTSFALVGVLSRSQDATACRCLEPSLRRAYALGDVVVLGSVESVDLHGEIPVVTFLVERAWKSNVPKRIRVAFGKTCAFSLQTSEKYLLFGTRIDTNSFGTRRCRGDRPYGEARAALDWLRRHGKEALVSD